VDFFIN